MLPQTLQVNNYIIKNAYALFCAKNTYICYNTYGDSMDLFMYENELYAKGINVIAGVDEVGRGPLVGPVVACCCVLPRDFKLALV